MGLLEGGGFFRPHNSWTSQAKVAEVKKRCPKVDDCPVQNSRRKMTPKEKRAAAKRAKAEATAKKESAKLKKAARIAKQQEKAAKQQGTWPHGGSWSGQTRGRGR